MQDYDTMPYRVEKTCPVCGTVFTTTRTKVLRGHGRYCSHACANRRFSTNEQRFWSRVNKDGPLHPHHPDLGPCWLWTGMPTTAGYGEIGVDGVLWMAHRYAYKLVHGRLYRALFACHSCDVPACVNPAHIFLGKQQDNMADCARKGRIARGERSAKAKLTAEQVRSLRHARCVDGMPYTCLAAQYGVTKATVRNAALGISWKQVTD